MKNTTLYFTLHESGDNYLDARRTCKINPSKCSIVSSLNRSNLTQMMSEKTSEGVYKPVQFGFISPEQEAVFSLLDAVGKIDDSKVTLTNSIVIDIGAGNSKLGYLSQNAETKNLVPYTYEIPYGTDTLDRRLEGNLDCVAKDSECPLLIEDSFSQFKKKGVNATPAFFESFSGQHKNVIMVGGIFWLIARSNHLEQACSKFTMLTPENFEQPSESAENLKKNLSAQLSKTLSSLGASQGKERCKDFVSADVERVLKQYSQKQKSVSYGVWLAKWLNSQITDVAGPSQRKIYVPNAQNDWMRWRVMMGLGLLDNVAIDQYIPRISRRSRDISRDSF